MAEAPFITRRLSPWLDLIRAMAAFAVLVGHAVQQGLYSGPWPFTIALQQNAVIVFFLLSGLVIAHSVDARPATLGQYALARAVRIVPVALPALAISVAVAAIAQNYGVSIGDSDHPVGTPIWEGLLPATLFLSESYRSGLWINPPFWSLCYEVWFYAIFAAASFLTGGRKAFCILVVAGIAGPNILLLLPIWLLGVWIARSPTARSMSFEQAGIRIALAMLALHLESSIAEPLKRLLKTVADWYMGYALYAPSYLVLGAALALGLTGLRKLVEDGPLDITRFATPIRAAANFSFSLYLLHWPLIGLLRIAGVSAGSNIFGFAGLLTGIAAVSAVYANFTENRRHHLQELVVNLLPARLFETRMAKA